MPDPVLPDYRDACLSNVVAAARGRWDGAWVPPLVRAARQVVLLVLDGLGWEQLRARTAIASTLATMEGGPITSVAPTTTATALTSITTGLPPARHGIVGYRIRVGTADVLNVLRWRTAAGDARVAHPPEHFQQQPIFGGAEPAVVTRADFSSTGFTRAHLPNAHLDGWSTVSSLVVNVAQHLRAGEPFIYAYYDGIDKVAHERGFGAHYDAEVRFADRIVGDVRSALPDGAALVVTSDHGQVEVGDNVLPLPPDVLRHTSMVSGEGRFRWLHARPGERHLLLKTAAEAFSQVAWVHPIEEMEAAGWFGGPLPREAQERLGDVAVVAHASVAVADPMDTGEASLRCRHGSLTPAEMFVPFLAAVR